MKYRRTVHCLVYQKHYTVEDVRSIIRDNKLRGLRIFSQLKDDRLSTLDFLAEYSFLEALDITSVDDYDFAFLASLRNLKELTIIVEGNSNIDLSNQENLETLTLEWRKGRVLALDKCYNLNSLCLVDYDEDDLTQINALGNLGDLKLKTASIRDLNGIENLRALHSLLLGNCKKLSSIDALKSLTELVAIHFELCPRIKSYDIVGSLSKITTLQIDDCKDISSIKFVEQLPLLETLSLLGNTNVLDGDLTPAKIAKNVYYKHRSHNNYRVENNSYDSTVKNNLNKIKGMFNQR